MAAHHILPPATVSVNTELFSVNKNTTHSESKNQACVKTAFIDVMSGEFWLNKTSHWQIVVTQKCNLPENFLKKPIVLPNVYLVKVNIHFF